MVMWHGLAWFLFFVFCSWIRRNYFQIYKANYYCRILIVDNSLPEFLPSPPAPLGLTLCPLFPIVMNANGS
jgi:hypothetical protein